MTSHASRTRPDERAGPIPHSDDRPTDRRGWVGADAEAGIEAGDGDGGPKWIVLRRRA